MKPLRAPSDFPPVAGGLLLGAAAIVTPWATASWLGLDEQLAQLIASAGPLHYPALLVLYGGSFIIIGTAARTALMLLGKTARGGNRLLDRGAGLLADAARGTGALFAGCFSLVGLSIRALTRPLEVWLHARLSRLREEQALWRSYREEFYQAYDSYAAFRRAYYGGEDSGESAGPQPPPPDTPDALAGAFTLMGLAADCSREEFEQRYRDLIKQVHPDRVGANGLATQLNEARALIRKQKGWTS